MRAFAAVTAAACSREYTDRQLWTRMRLRRRRFHYLSWRRFLQHSVYHDYNQPITAHLAAGARDDVTTIIILARQRDRSDFNTFMYHFNTRNTTSVSDASSTKIT